LHGKPGAGKTTTARYLSRHVVKEWHLYTPIVPTEDTSQENLKANITVASVYLKFNDADQSKYVNILLSFIAQLSKSIQGGDGFVDNIIQKADDDKQTSVKDATETLVSMLKRTGPACLFVDALDEYPEQDDDKQFVRSALLECLEQIQSKTNVGLVLTSRTGVCEWKDYFNNPTTYELQAHPCDIEFYINRQFKLRKPKWARDQCFRERVINTIVQASNER